MNLADPLLRHARERAHAVALIYRDRLIRYGQLKVLVWRMASALRAQGLGPGDRVGITVQRPVLHVVTMLALARLGAVQIAMAPTQTAAMRRSIAGRLGLAAVVRDIASDDDAAPVLVIDPAWLEQRIPAGAATAPGGEAPFMAGTSSGTTGEPKLFLVSHRMELERAVRDAALFEYLPGERYASLVDLHFTVSRRRVLYCLAAGGCVFLPRAGLAPPQLLEEIDRHDVRHISGTPYHAERILEHLRGEQPRLPGLRIFRLGASATSVALQAAVTRRLTPAIHVVYGCNEASTISGAGPDLLERVPGTVGRPMAPLEVQVVDDAGRPLPAGETGLVRVRGPGVIGGYLDDPEATARSFRDGWFRPGDLASFTPDGLLMHHGRADDMMIFDGINIHPQEIEQVLLAHEAVAAAVAFGLDSQRHNQIPAAAVVLRQQVDQRSLTAFCRDRLGARMPHRLFVLDELPRNGQGKVSRKRLAASLGRAAPA
ncbi:AMP-binding protein (plasmid) [Geminicoccaceae bacterium 1502E]|nr:AMP-binding protein [Geminicoccaceae bacterium 1502E]